jgi:hypothetical protein
MCQDKILGVFKDVTVDAQTQINISGDNLTRDSFVRTIVYVKA